MPLKNAEVVSILNELIETCEDGLHGFKTASDAVDNPVAKALFVSRLPNILRGESELKAEVRRLGGDPDKRGTVAGAFDTRAIIERQYRGVVENLGRVRALGKDVAPSSTNVGSQTPRPTDGEIRL